MLWWVPWGEQEYWEWQQNENMGRISYIWGFDHTTHDSTSNQASCMVRASHIGTPLGSRSSHESCGQSFTYRHPASFVQLHVHKWMRMCAKSLTSRGWKTVWCWPNLYSNSLSNIMWLIFDCMSTSGALMMSLTHQHLMSYIFLFPTTMKISIDDVYRCWTWQCSDTIWCVTCKFA